METINNLGMEGGVEGDKDALKAFKEMSQDAKIEMAKKLFSAEELELLDDADYRMILNTATRYLERDPGTTAIEDALTVGAIARAEALELMGGKSMKNYVYDNQGSIIGAGPDKESAIRRAQELRKEN